MNKFKDFLYYISDLILAFIVLVIMFFVFYKNISIFFYDIFRDGNLSVKLVKEIIEDTKVQDEKDLISEDIKKDEILKKEHKIQENSNINEDLDNKTKNIQNIENGQNSQNEDSKIDLQEISNKQIDIKIVIPPNSISTDIVNILYDNKIISSKEEMSAYLRDNNLETKLKSGTFILNPSMSTQEIANKLSLIKNLKT